MVVLEKDNNQRYSAFGLTISTEISFPELPISKNREQIDVTIRQGEVSTEQRSGEETPSIVFQGSQDFILLYRACDVHITDGKEIIVDPRENASLRDVRWVILGPALNFLLHQRGHLILHASTVGVNGSAVAFVGESGAGKSTTAAAFVDAGHNILSDDIAAINTLPSATAPIVQPGFPSIKLHHETASMFGSHLTPAAKKHNTREDVYSDANERFYRVNSFDSTPYPLAAIYRLTRGDDLAVNRIDPSRAAIELARNAYTVGTQSQRTEASQALETAAEIAESVPIATLRRPQEFEVLSDLVEFIEKEVQA